jgi:hypothetical protein
LRKVHNEELHNLHASSNTAKLFKSGHIACMSDINGCHAIGDYLTFIFLNSLRSLIQYGGCANFCGGKNFGTS